jgi:hypothetical protein
MHIQPTTTRIEDFHHVLSFRKRLRNVSVCGEDRQGVSVCHQFHLHAVWIIGPLLFLLTLLTLLAKLASLQEHTTTITSPRMLTSRQRSLIIHGLEQEYTSQLASSLQGQVAIELHLQERTDIIASSASLIFHHRGTTQASPLPGGTSMIQVYDRASRGLLILGVPGSGKTTQLLMLAHELLQRAENDPDQPLTIILNLSSWAKTQLPLKQWLSEQCSLVYGIPKQLSAAWIIQEQVQSCSMALMR